MSSQAIPAKPKAQTTNSDPKLTVLAPYLVAILAQLPLLFLYFKSLWVYKPHYQFIPFAIAVVAYLAWSRWPRDSKMPFHRSVLSDSFLVFGLLVGLTNCLFLEPWLAAFSCLLLATSLFARTYDVESGKSLIALSLPLLVCLVPPKRGDMWIITKLQRISANFTSQLLDVVGYGHHMPGTVIKAPGTDGFGIAEACSGVQSFFTLLFVAIVFSVWNRRPWFRSFMLMASTIFWAILMNTIRIFAIPMSDRIFGWDLSSGVAHMLLGYTTLAIGILLLFSTDQFLIFLLGGVEADSGESSGLTRAIARGWNRFVAGTEDEDSSNRRSNRRKNVSSLSKSLILGVAVLMLLGGAWQLIDVGRSLFTTSKKVKFFESMISQPYERNDLPDSIDGWALDVDQPYIPESRESGNDLGLRSDTWIYTAPRQFQMLMSLDQTFPGWHELTICYQNQGWKLESRVKRKASLATDPSKTWNYIEAEFSKNTGERGYLVFSLFDAFGAPYDPPEKWETVDFFLSRLRNRLSQRIRAQLFRGETFQAQAFVATFGPLTDVQKEQITSRYIKLREPLRRKFMERQKIDVESPKTDSTNSSTSGE